MSFIEKEIGDFIVLMPLNTEDGSLIKLSGSYIYLWNKLKISVLEVASSSSLIDCNNKFINFLEENLIYFDPENIDATDLLSLDESKITGVYELFDTPRVSADDQVMAFALGPQPIQSNGTSPYGGAEPCGVDGPEICE